jgi:hypothetical protein
MGLLRGLRVVVMAVFALASLALAESFDTFEYQVPKGWSSKEFPGGVNLTLATKESFSSIVLYASVPAGTDATKNFLGEWQRLVTEGLELQGEPTVEVGPANGGYGNVAGGMVASQDGTDFLVLLSTFSGNGRAASVLYITTDEAALETFDAFNSALKLVKPKAAATPPPQQPAQQVLKRAIATPTTKFDDGWTATVEEGFVRVVKGDLTVFLHDPLPIPASMWVIGNEQERVQYYWGKLVTPKYRADEIKVFDESGFCYTCLYFGESTATDLTTGARKHVALYLIFGKGGGSAVQVVAPDFASFQREFPTIETVGRMPGYNKFAVKATDLTGTWTENYFGATQDYNAVTGSYIGMNAITSNDTFTFTADGAYTSRHQFAGGYVGSQNFNQTDYKGSVKVSDWQVSLSNRFKGETEVYEAYFEVVSGQPILHLSRPGTNLTYTLGQQKR